MISQCFVSSPCLLSADGTKIYSCIYNNVDVKKLHQDIDNFLKQSEVWQMPFNISKCKSLHLGSCNPRHAYYMHAWVYSSHIEQISEEKDLGILPNRWLKFHNHAQYSKAIKKVPRSHYQSEHPWRHFSIKTYC